VYSTVLLVALAGAGQGQVECPGAAPASAGVACSGPAQCGGHGGGGFLSGLFNHGCSGCSGGLLSHGHGCSGGGLFNHGHGCSGCSGGGWFNHGQSCSGGGLFNHGQSCSGGGLFSHGHGCSGGGLFSHGHGCSGCSGGGLFGSFGHNRGCTGGDGCQGYTDNYGGTVVAPSAPAPVPVPVAPTPAPTPAPKKTSAPTGADTTTEALLPPATAIKNATDAAPMAPATINVELPANAKLFIDGAPTKSMSDRRAFVTPPLAPGKAFNYTLRLELAGTDQPITETRTITVMAGQTTNVVFANPIRPAALPSER